MLVAELLAYRIKLLIKLTSGVSSKEVSVHIARVIKVKLELWRLLEDLVATITSMHRRSNRP